MSGGSLGPPVTPGGSLGPPGASGYPGALLGPWGLRLLLGPLWASWGLRLLLGLWGLLGPPVTPGGPSGASWGLRLPRGPFTPAKPDMAVVRVCAGGCALGSAGKKRAAPGRSFLSTPAREGASVGAPAAGATAPLGLSSSLNIVKKSGGGLESDCGCGTCAARREAPVAPGKALVRSGALWGWLPRGLPWGLRLLPGPSGASLGPPGAGALWASWGLRLLPGLSGASWGLRLPRGPLWGLLGLRLLPGPFHC